MNDPVVLICIGIFLVGFFLLWAIGKLWKFKTPSQGAPLSVSDDLAAASSDLKNIEIDAYEPIDQPPLKSAVRPAGAPAGQAATVLREPFAASLPLAKDVAERLDTMAQRLGEMQTVLTKQAAVPPSAAGIGQGFSPETVDKLLKIIGNVIQQVDVLQKSLTVNAPSSGAEPSVSAGGKSGPAAADLNS